MSETKGYIKLELEQAIKSGINCKTDLLNISSRHIFKKNKDITLEVLDEMKLKYAIIEGKIYLYIGEDEQGFDKSVNIIKKNIESVKINRKKKAYIILNIISIISFIISIIIFICSISRWGGCILFIISFAIFNIAIHVDQSYGADIIELGTKLSSL